MLKVKGCGLDIIDIQL